MAELDKKAAELGIDLTARIGDISFENPIMTASGTFSARESGAGEWLDAYLPDVLGELLAHPAHPGCLWNVNFPDCPKEQCRGVRRGTVPARYGLYDNEYIRDGAHLRIASTVADPALCREGSDIHAVLNGYISIGEIRSPLL